MLFNYIVDSIQSPLTTGFVADKDLLAAIIKHKGEGYHSLFNMEKRDDYKSYQGQTSISLGWFPLDFDSENLEDARRDVIKAWQSLSLSTDFARIYFSGRKGFHLYIRQEYFPDTSSVPAIRALAVRWKQRHALGTLDVSIIQANRKFRLPNSLHPKTKLYKVELDFDQLVDWPIAQIQAFAKNPRDISLHQYSAPARRINDTPAIHVGNSGSDAQSLQAEEIVGPGAFGTEHIIAEDTAYSAFKDKVCIKRMWEATLPVGERHATILALIGDAYETGMDKKDTEVRLAAWAARNNVLDRWELDIVRALNERYDERRAHSYGCYSPTKQAHCSGTCALYPRLKKELRAVVADIPPTVQKQLDKSDQKEAKKSEKALRKEGAFVRGLPDWGDKSPRCTIENIKHMLEQLNIGAHYDMIKKDLKITIPNSRYLIDTEKNDKLSRIVSYATKCGMPHGQVAEYVAFVASQNPINPVAQWIESKPWDGTTRLQDFYNTVTCTGPSQALKETLLKRWMVSAVAAAFLPNGVSAHGVLVFAGAQYLGKTNWFNNLVPAELDFTRNGMLLDIKDKDSVYQIVSNWIVELGEVDATFRKSDIAQLKAFLTRNVDIIRLPYRREAASFARRTVFFASVNDSNYLADPTGNRRFWTIECESINHTHGLDMQQVWAEFYLLFKAKEAWHLTHAEMLALNTHNQNHENESPFEDKIRDEFVFDGSGALEFMTATQVSEVIGYKQPSPRTVKAVGAAVRKVTGQVAQNNNSKQGYYLQRAVAKAPGLND